MALSVGRPRRSFALRLRRVTARGLARVVTYGSGMQLDDLVAAIVSARRDSGRPIVVGISGYGGSGKSTLARALVERIPAAVRVRGDDFLDPQRSHRRSATWDGVDRARLVDEVVGPFRERRAATFRRFDWGRRALGEPEDVPVGEVLIIDVVGLLCPETEGALDLSVWCDVDLDTATGRGLARDAALGRDHVWLWHEVWVPNERDFDRAFRPRARADVRYRA